MQFNYQARTKEGEIQTGTVEAGSRETAVKTLQRHDLVVVYLEAVSAVPFYLRSFKFLRRIKAKDIVMLYRQLAILFEANTPLMDALKAIVEQAKNPYLKEILSDVENDVRGGEALSQALAKHKKTFSSFYVSVIQSGEATGRLDEILKYLADHAEKEHALKSKVRGAFIYPIFILSVFTIIAVLMLMFVIPQLTVILIETGTELPLSTKMLIAASKFLRSWFWLVVIILAGVIFGFFRFLKSKQGRAIWDNLKLKLPVIGKLFRQIYLARFAENFSTLLKGGVAILTALRISSQVVGNKVYADLIKSAEVEVKKGGEISAVFERDKKNIPPTVVQMLKIGEKTAKLDYILERLAIFYRTEIDRVTDNLAQLIEPALIILLGGGVAFLVASILMPIYNISSGGF